MTLTYIFWVFPVAFITMIAMIVVDEYTTSRQSFAHWLTADEEAAAAKQITDRLTEEAKS